MLPLLFVTLAAAAPACVFVESERIHARDLAAVAPEFAMLPADAFISYSPQPGVKRIFDTAEIGAMLNRHGVAGAKVTQSLCAEWKMEPLDADRVRTRAAELLGVSASYLELLDWSRVPVPVNSELVLTPDGLRPLSNAEDTGIWRGYVRYGGNRRINVWARLRAQIPHTRVVAATDLRAGQRITATELRVESQTGLPEPGAASSLDEVAGKLAKRSVPAGAPLQLTAVAEPTAIVRGDTVQVEVRCGAARIRFDGVAQSAAAIGQTLAVKNNETAKVVRARVEAPGLAVLSLSDKDGGL